MMGVCTANRGHLLHYLEKSGVRLYNCTKVKALAKDGVYVEQNQSQTVPDPYNTWQPLLPPNIPNPMEKAIKEEIVEKKIPADLIVLAMGGKADETFSLKREKNIWQKRFITLETAAGQEEFWRQYAVHIILQCGFSGKEEKV